MPTIIERFPAIVTSIDDDKKRGRIKVKCGAFTGDYDLELPDFIEPSLDWGWFVVPDLKEEIEIEVTIQDATAEDALGAAAIEGPNMRWRMKRFEALEGKAPRPPHDLFTSTNYGKRRGFSTPLGHVIMFDDTPGQEQVTLSWTNKAGDKFAYISFDKTGSALLSNKVGSLIHLDAEKAETKIIDSNSNLISMTATGIAIFDAFQNIVEMKDGVVQILSSKNVLINSGANVTVEAGAKVQLNSDDVLVGNGADSPFVRHTEWEAWASTHTHTAPGGMSPAPTSPPIVAPTPTIASTKAKVK